MGIDPKYIRTHTQVIGERIRWFLNKMGRDWTAWNDELDRRELGQDELTAARTLDAAGWTLAPGEAHKLDALDAIARGDQAAAVRSRLAANVEIGHMTPVEAIDAQRAYNARQAAMNEWPDKDELDDAVRTATAISTWDELQKAMAPNGFDQIYKPTLRDDVHPNETEIIRAACKAFGFDCWPERGQSQEAELDGPSLGD